MMQCTPSSFLNNWFNRIGPNVAYSYVEPKLLFGWRRDVSGSEITHLMSFQRPDTSLEFENSEQLELRAACHYLLDLVSDRGLSEVLEHLKENLEFYSSRSEVPSLPAQSSIPIKLGLKYERPTFHVTEE